MAVSKQITVTGQQKSDYYRYATLHKSGRIVFRFEPTKDEIQAWERNDDILNWWKFAMDYHVDKYEFIQTAWFAGADQEQLKNIAFFYWQLNDLDCSHYIMNERGLTLEREGNSWLVYDDRKEFDINSACGKGKMLLLALIDYRFKASKMENERAYAGTRG